VAGAVDTPAETEGVGPVWPPGAGAEPALWLATTTLLAWGISLATGRWLLPGLALDGGGCLFKCIKTAQIQRLRELKGNWIRHLALY
jgi:hypothetical protein